MKKIILWIIYYYKKHISSYLSKNGINCKFYPTCSDYAIEAINKYGVIKGGTKSIIRILRCNPFSKGGYDPLK